MGQSLCFYWGPLGSSQLCLPLCRILCLEACSARCLVRNFMSFLQPTVGQCGATQLGSTVLHVDVISVISFPVASCDQEQTARSKQIDIIYYTV